MASAALAIPLTSAAERVWTAGGFADGVRADGRSPSDLRRVELGVGGLPAAAGSAEVRLGGTHVVVAVQVELSSPDPSTPDAGTLVVDTEVSPCVGPSLQGAAASDAAAALSRSLERALVGGTPALDLASLCLAPGAVAWRLSVRVLLLAADGGEVLAASLAARAALAVARIPAATVSGGGGGEGGGPPEVEVDDDLRAATRLDASRVPALITVAVADWPVDGGARPQSHIVVDPTAAEVAAAGVAAAVAVDGSGNVRGCVLGGSGGLSPACLGAVLAMVRRTGPALLRGVDEAVAAADTGNGGGGAMVVG